MTAEKLFELACAGGTETLRELYHSGQRLDVTYEKFGKEHSLIMGAFRNRQWHTVRWLLGNGAKLTPAEQAEINDRYQEMRLIEEMQENS
jgi:hypothetical protein